MKTQVALLVLLASFGAVASAESTCLISTYPTVSVPVEFSVSPNNMNLKTVGQFKIQVITDADGAVIVASIEDTKSGVNADAYSSDKKTIALQLHTPSSNAALNCLPKGQ